jgi:hypothetical protein
MGDVRLTRKAQKYLDGVYEVMPTPSTVKKVDQALLQGE